MKRTLFPFLLIAASVLLLVVGTAACGDDDEGGGGDGGATTAGGDGTVLVSYLRELNEIQEGVSDATDTVGEQSEQAFSNPTQARQSLSAAIDVADSAVTALEALDVPEEASAAHAELIAAGENLVDAATAVNSDLQGVEPGAEFDTLAEEAQAPDSELSQAIDRMIQACESMAALAEENNTNVDLACPAPND